jgi:hypothetical protein
MTAAARLLPHLALRTAWLWLAALFLSGSAWAVEPDYGSLIDIAGRQRMLSQRIVKAYCQVGLQVTPEVSRAQLGGAVKRFDSQLQTLAAKAPDADARSAVARVAGLWRGLRQTARAPVSRDGARALATRSEALLQASQVLVLALERAAASPEAKMVNTAGRQRMLSQRLAKLYMLRAWDIDSASVQADIEASGKEFAAALASLRAARENTPAIRAELEAVALQWEWFRSAIELQGAESYALVVADASESILNSMELITAKYARLARQ